MGDILFLWSVIQTYNFQKQKKQNQKSRIFLNSLLKSMIRLKFSYICNIYLSIH